MQGKHLTCYAITLAPKQLFDFTAFMDQSLGEATSLYGTSGVCPEDLNVVSLTPGRCQLVVDDFLVII